MNKIRFAATILAMACISIGLAGCKESEEKIAEAARRAKEKARVTPEAKEQAEQELEKVWEQVKPVVDRDRPDDKDRMFYNHLAVLTRFDHRLAGMGKVEVREIGPDGEVMATRALDRLEVSRETTVETSTPSAKLEAANHIAHWLKWTGMEGPAERCASLSPAPTIKSAEGLEAADYLVRQSKLFDMEGLGEGLAEMALPPERRLRNVEVKILDAPGSLAAGRYVENYLKHIGVDELYVQAFPVVQPVTTECRLFVNGEEVTGPDVYQTDTGRPVIYQVRPNILQASVTPQAGLSGRTIYVKDGDLEDYPAMPDDKIVVIDFDCMTNWLKAFALGARAVIFIGPADGRPAARAYHHVNVPANLPRFYVPGDVAAKLKLTGSRQVTIKSAVSWRRFFGRNVVGVIRGTDPKLIAEDPKPDEAKDRKDQAILLAASLDSLSEIPYLSPGARYAANCAALLEIARHLQENRPRRDVILCFFDGQAQNNLGARAFYGNGFRKRAKEKVTLEKLVEMYEDELELREGVMRIVRRQELRFEKLSDETPSDSDREEIRALGLFSDETKELPRYKDVLEVLRNESRYGSSAALDLVPPFRLEKENLKAELKAMLDSLPEKFADVESLHAGLETKQAALTDAGKEVPEDLAKKVAKLREYIDISKKYDRLWVEDRAWNSIERVLYDDLDVHKPEVRQEMHKNAESKYRDALIAATPRKFEELFKKTREVCERRIDELQTAEAITGQGKALRDALGPDSNNILLHLSINFGDRRPLWGFIHGDNSLIGPGQDALVNYKTILGAFERLAEEGKCKDEVSDMDEKSVDLTYPNRLLAPAKFADSACVARVFSLFNLSAMTIMDPLARQGQPVDTPQALNKPNVLSQARQLAALLPEFADDRELIDVAPKFAPTARYLEPEWDVRKSKGILVARRGGASAMPDQPIRNAIVAAGPSAGGPWNSGIIENLPPGFQYPIIVATNSDGIVELPVHSSATYGTVVLFAATFDKPPAGDDGEKGISRGIIRAVTNAKTMIGSGGNRAVEQFKARSKTFVGYGFNRGVALTEPMLGRSTSRFQEDRHLSCELENIVTVYVHDDADTIKLFNKQAMVILNNDDTAKRYEGVGLSLVSLEDEFEHPVTPLLTARDLRNLNQYRLNLLRKNRITQQSLGDLNSIASDMLEDAEKIYAELRSAFDNVVGKEASSAEDPRGVNAPQAHVLVRHPLRSPIAQGRYDALRGHFRGRAEVVPRYWVSPTAQEAQNAEKTGQTNDLLLTTEDVSLRQPIKAAVGLDSRDIRLQPELAHFFIVKPTPQEQQALQADKTTKTHIIIDRLENDGIFLTEPICEQLGLTLDDAGKTVLLPGQKLKFAGIVDDKLGGYTTPDGASTLPVDYETSAGAAGESFTEPGDESLLESPDIESAQFASYSVHEVVWVSAKTAARMSNRIRAISIYPNDQASIRDLAKQAASIAKLPTYFGDARGVYNTFTSLTEGGGTLVLKEARAAASEGGASAGNASPGVKVDQVAGKAASSAEYSRCVYGPTRGVMDDLVSAVVLLLLMTIPFAYALERLLIGTPHIYRQIGWFGAFFILTFAVLYLVNPAFRIASTPIIILLAFTIILLSSLVIFIMVRKLQTEIKRMQGLATTVHSADVSRLSTMMAAVNMGISTMRRRRLRTFLTATTVLLLTFTILTFASFGSSWGVRQTSEDPTDIATPHIFVRHQLRSPVAQGVYDALRGHLRGVAAVVPRYWVSPTAQEAQNAEKTGQTNDLLLTTEDVSLRQPIKAAVGLDTKDIKHQPELARHFIVKPTAKEEQALKDKSITNSDIIIDRLENDGIFLTEPICEQLGITIDDSGKTVLLADQELKFAGIVNDKLGGYTTLEGSSVLPVDYQTSAGAAGETFTDQADESLLERPDIESAQFASYSLHEVAWIPAKTAVRMNNRIRAISIYPLEPGTIKHLAEETACISKLPTYFGERGGFYRDIFTSLTKASGVKGLFIPVVVGGMIVFATLLGSVSDREREIYTFSSLGLAPPHVASLFFAEASIYAIVGGMGGYLLGQVVARVLAWLHGMGLVGSLTINYSSTNAIFTILVVMGTVMISTIYPAMKASRSANPGIQRAWKIPKPEGNLYDLVFPFTVSAYDITGVVSFLREHFDNYRDASLGVFATTECAVFRQKNNDMLAFRATVALAPFDLGVNQQFAILSQPSEIEGIDEVRILIYRLSGANGDWRRANRVFVNDLRKQLLIWRSLPEDTMDKYRQMTLEAWGALPVQQVDGRSIAQSASEEDAFGADFGAEAGGPGLPDSDKEN